MNQKFEYPLGGGVLTLPGDDVKILTVGLVRSPVYSRLRAVLEAMKQACDVGLRDHTARIDEIRVLQGRVAALGDLAIILEQEIPAFYDAQIRKES